MKTFDFYGVCNNRYKLNDTIWEAREDPSDGFRSYLDSIEVSEEKHDDIFFRDSLGKVFVQGCEEVDGWQIVDEATGHVWLKIGTDYTVSYYPFFVFEYTPKDPKKYNPDESKKTWELFISDEE